MKFKIGDKVLVLNGKEDLAEHYDISDYKKSKGKVFEIVYVDTADDGIPYELEGLYDWYNEDMLCFPCDIEFYRNDIEGGVRYI